MRDRLRCQRQRWSRELRVERQVEMPETEVEESIERQVEMPETGVKETVERQVAMP